MTFWVITQQPHWPQAREQTESIMYWSDSSDIIRQYRGLCAEADFRLHSGSRFSPYYCVALTCRALISISISTIPNTKSYASILNATCHAGSSITGIGCATRPTRMCPSKAPLVLFSRTQPWRRRSSVKTHYHFVLVTAAHLAYLFTQSFATLSNALRSFLN